MKEARIRSRIRRIPVCVYAFVAASAVAACGGGNAASQLATTPEYQPKDQTKCHIAKSQSRPLVVEWPSAARQALESRVRQGVVVVRYRDCEMDVLDRCSVPASYGYRATTMARDEVVIKDDDDLYANLPMGAARLEGRLKRSGQLTVDMSLVGRYESEKPTVRPDELKGDCAGATHFIYGVAVGAFDFYAAGEAQVGGGVGLAGVGGTAASQAQRETLTKNGEASACEGSTTDDKAPPKGCGAIIRVEVVPLGEAQGLTPSPGPSASGGPLPSIPGKWATRGYGGPATITFDADGTATYRTPTTAPGRGRWTASGARLRFDLNGFSNHVCMASSVGLSCQATNKNGEWSYLLTRGL